MRRDPASLNPKASSDGGFAVVGVILAVVIAAGIGLGFTQVHRSQQNRPDQTIPAEDVTRPSPTLETPANNPTPPLSTTP